jgi:hypothetical protein
MFLPALHLPSHFLRRRNFVSRNQAQAGFPLCDLLAYIRW